MLKYQDYHFGNDLAEVVLKFICWAGSFAIIYYEQEDMGSDVLSSTLALPVFIFSLSCVCDTITSLKQKTRPFAIIIFIALLISLLYICGASLIAASNLHPAPSNFVFHFHVIYFIVMGYMLFDFFFIKIDSIRPSPSSTPDIIAAQRALFTRKLQK